MKTPITIDEPYNKIVMSGIRSYLKSKSDGRLELYYYISKNKFDHIDSKALLIDTKTETPVAHLSFEIKNRFCKSTTYPDTFIKVSKYNDIMQFSNVFDKMFYVMSFEDGMVFVWDMRKIDTSKTQTKYVKKVQYNQTPEDGERESQEVFVVKFDEAFIKFNLNEYGISRDI